MGTSNPSRSRSKGNPVAGKAGSGKPSVHLISLELTKTAPPLVEMKDGKTTPTSAGLLLGEVWRSLGEGRRFLVPDAYLLGPQSFRGILRVQSGDPASMPLAEPLRLFKLLGSRALAAAGQVPTPGASKAAPIWKRGYSETTLGSMKQIVDARRALGR